MSNTAADKIANAILNPPTLEDSIKAITTGIGAKYGTSMGQLGAVIVPAMFRMGLTQLAAIKTQIDSKNTAAAMQLIQDAMTPAELADQKVVLADLTIKMADEKAANIESFWNNFVLAGLKIGLAALIPVVLP